jgi:pimeloyl-ACP methyl ester carboxylesterase
VLLHGFASTPHTLALVARHVRVHLNRPLLRPNLGLGFGDLARAAERVHAAIAASGAREVDVVGHSLGGLVASYLLKRLDRGRRVRRVVTLGTPHMGAPLAWLGAAATLGLSRSMRQLRPGSAFLAELAAAPVPARSELIALVGEADAMVPERFARLDRAPRQHSIVLAGLDHMRLIFHPAALDQVGELLSAGVVSRRLERRTARTRMSPRVPGWSSPTGFLGPPRLSSD